MNENEQNIIRKAVNAVKSLRDPSTAQAYSGSSGEFGAGWYDIGVTDATGGVICVASAYTDIGSHAESLETEINKLLPAPRKMEEWER